MNVREATAADVEAIRRIARLSWHDTYEGLLSRDWIDSYLARWYEPSLLLEQIESAAASEDECFLIAEGEDGQPVGYLNFVQMPDRGPYLKRLYVLPEAQGMGAGSALVAELHSRLTPGSAYELDVHPGNSVAIAFYRSHGAGLTGATLEPCWVLMRLEVGSPG